MKAMFQECFELISLDLSKFNTSKVTDMQWMFYNFKKLNDLNILNFTINEICNIENMIENIANDCYFKINSKALKKWYLFNHLFYL